MTKQKQVRVWDLPTRLFHWLLVTCIASSWYTVEVLEDMQLHFYSGYAILTLLLFRIGWGFIGSYYSRFSQLLFAPAEIINYLKVLTSANPKRYVGHNPLGSLAVILMLAILIAQVSTGLFAGDDYYFGPLAGLVAESTIARLSDLHHQNFELLKIIIVIHILAIILYRLVKKEPLTVAMLNGRKETDQLTEPVQVETANRLFAAAIVLIASLAIAYAIVNLLAEPVIITPGYY